MNFRDYPPEQLKQLSQKANETKRSPELRWAWANADKLRKENKTLGIKELSGKYNVSYRSMTRILRGK